MIRTQIYIPETLYQTINLLARQEKKPAAQVIRELLTSGLQTRQKPATIGKALLKLTHVNAHAPADTSMQIDRYLYEK